MNKRTKSLEAIRVLMMIIIVVSHFGFLKNYSYGGVYSKYIQNATLGVDYFFILSGYGLMKSYKNAEAKQDIVSSIRFAISKIKKIYFPYVLSLIVFLPYCLYYSIEDNGLGYALIKTSVKLSACLALIQSLSGRIAYAHAINGVGWFLSSIFIIYIMCPTLMKWISSCKSTSCIRALCIVCVAKCAFVKVLLQYIGLGYGLDDLSYSFPFARVFYVIFGMLICRLLDANQVRKETHKDLLMEILTSVAAVGWFVVRNNCHMPIYIVVCFDLIVCGTLVYVFAQEKSCLSHKLSLSRLAEWGGSMMYVYLFHYPVVIYVDFLFQNHRYIIGDFTGVFEVVIIVLLTIFIVKFVEKLNRII